MLASRVLAMDETSIKAGREAKGKMRTGWLWPVYGDAEEVVFHYRHTHTQPVVETFWRWCRAQCHRTELLPKSPLANALNYALERRSGLEVFLDAPEVAIDTNHLYADNRFMPTLRPKPLTDRVAPVGLSA